MSILQRIIGGEESSDEGIEDVVDEDNGPVAESVDDMNKRLISSPYTNELRNKLLSGGSWTRTFFTSKWPDEPQDQFLDNVINKPPHHNDMSLFIDPRDTDAAIRRLKRRRDDLRRQIGTGEDVVAEQDRNKKLQKIEAMIDILSDTGTNTRLFDVSMYTTVRSTEDELDVDASDIRSELEGPPAFTDQQIPSHAQQEALKSVSPIAKNVFGENENFKTKSLMMSGALAATLPFTSKTIIEEDGVEMGIQDQNSSPVLVERWGRGNGYNQITVGTIGSGKSYSTKLNILRTYAAHDDVIIFMLDPLEGFANVCDHLGGLHIPVGGGKTLNPLEIKAPDDIERVKNESADPYAQKLQSVIGFIRSFMKQEEKEIGAEMSMITKAVHVAYRLKDIEPDDLESHANESPTMLDVLEVLRDMSSNPEEYAEVAESDEPEKIEDLATTARLKLQEFREGRSYNYLSGQTQMDLDSNDVVYLDLKQQEGSGDLGLMMQILFEQVYQRAKTTDKKVLFAIDEARYIMKSADTLEFLAQAVRHSRHYDMSINFITQTAEEFTRTDEAQAILDQCVIRLLQKTEGLDQQVGRELGLNDPQISFVRNAQQGDDPDSEFSQAMLGVEGDFIPLQVHSSDVEEMLVTMSEKEIREEM
jgi:hypothetical protein